MEGTNNEQHQPEHQPSGPPPPRIYAASLADYNDGRLHGEWIEANQDPGELQAEIDAMLRSSPLPAAEEWAIHDYEGFGSLRLSEYESIETVARLARGIEEHGLVFTAWVEHVGTSDEEALDQFDQHYLGTWDSLSDYAEQLLDDLGVDVDRLLPEWLRPYVRLDYEQLGQDLACDLYVTEDGSTTHLFQA